jgi:putative ATP-dependent endonuclease of OLD family
MAVYYGSEEGSMIIKSVHVENFRCIRKETLHCERLTALVGANGTGKSSFLRALQLFYTAGARYTEQDFYGGDTEKPIIIRVTFTSLADEEQELFDKYVVNGELTVEKELTWPLGRGSQKYYGASMRNPDFQPIRSAPNATEMRRLYQGLQGQEKYASLPKWTKKDDAPPVLETWENQHPDQCSMGRDDGQFFGFKEVGRAHLERFTRFLFIPAVRDASEDAAEGRGTVLSDLMDLVVRSTLAERKEIQELHKDTQERYKEIMDPANLSELSTLQTNLSETLSTYVPDASVNLDWITDQQIDIPLPRANVRLVEDGYPSPVARAGHGLQRAFILTMLQHLAKAQAPSLVPPKDKTTPNEGNETGDGLENMMPNLILGIEEPELYQHPNRQRHLSGVLYRLAHGQIKGVAQNTQILYATHSPLFVNLGNFHTVRLLRKYPPTDGGPKCTVVCQTTLDEIAAIVEAADDKPPGTYSGATLRPRLQTLMTPWMNEGFFAHVAVLVEGEDDRAAILGVARSKDCSFESMGISVIPCMGKNNLDRPTAIFRQLQIPVYVVWDGDHGDKDARPEDNHRLLRLLGADVEDWPEGVRSSYACFEQDLETTLRAELGEELFREVLDKCRSELGFTKDKHATKCPVVVQRIIESARQEGKSSTTLECIVNSIVALRAA